VGRFWWASHEFGGCVWKKYPGELSVGVEETDRPTEPGLREFHDLRRARPFLQFTLYFASRMAAPDTKSRKVQYVLYYSRQVVGSNEGQWDLRGSHGWNRDRRAQSLFGGQEKPLQARCEPCAGDKLIKRIKQAYHALCVSRFKGLCCPISKTLDQLWCCGGRLRALCCCEGP
jgi:hypothetical protein